MRPLLIIGSSGQAGVVLDALRFQKEFAVVGLLDSFMTKGSFRHGHVILGSVDEAAQIAVSHSCKSFCVAVGHNWHRATISARIARDIAEAEFPVVIHPHVSVSESCSIGAGTVIMAGAVIGINCSIGSGCIINTSCSVNHDCNLGEYSSIGPGTHLGGSVSIGARTAIGIGSTIRHKIAIGEDALIGAGAVVVTDVPDRVVAYGVPARVIRGRLPNEEYL